MNILRITTGFRIRHGLGGGFGGSGDWEYIEANDYDDAMQQAWQAACEDYEMYEGMYGLQSWTDIEEENPDWDDTDIEMEYNDQRESRLEYEAEEV